MIRRLVALLLSILLIAFANTAMGESTLTTKAVLLARSILHDHPEVLSDYDITSNGRYITVHIVKEGLGAELQKAADAGYDETYPSWVEYKQGLISMHQEIITMFQDNGRDDLELTIWLENDMKGTGERCRWGNYLLYMSDGEWLDDMALGREPWDGGYRQDVSYLPDDIQPIHVFLTDFLTKAGFDYVNVDYVEKSNHFNVDVAMLGLGEVLYQGKLSGNYSIYLEWVSFTKEFDAIYDYLLRYFESVGHPEIEMKFSVVNDELYIRDYWDRSDFDRLYTILPTIIFGERHTVDIMESLY